VLVDCQYSGVWGDFLPVACRCGNVGDIVRILCPCSVGSSVVVLARVVIVSKCGDKLMRRIVLCATVILLLVTKTSAAVVTTPSDLIPGDQYRLAFLTSTHRNAASVNVGDYNAFVYNAAIAVPELASLGVGWNAIISTHNTDARDNTGTNPFLSSGVPIYLLNDTKLADDNNDLWDGSIDAPLNITELGGERLSQVWSGTITDGTASSKLPGSLQQLVGSSIGTEVTWIAQATHTGFGPFPFYGISNVLTVPTGLANPGFEITEITGGAFPTTFGDWTGDVSEIVTAQNSIIPAEGDKMLRFLNTSPTGPAFPGSSSDVWQLVDVSSLATEVTAGRVAVEVSALFNRVAGDLETDTEFSIEINALDGVPTDFLAQKVAGSELAISTTKIITDGEFWTWEEAGTSVLLPAGTEYIAIMVNAVENTVNDGVAPEFAGHYADDVAMAVTIVEPGDLNGDGLVDAADAGIMFGNWGSTVFGYFDGNLNGDEYIDAADAGIMFANWTGDTGPVGATVPEPTTSILALTALLLTFGRHRTH